MYRYRILTGILCLTFILAARAVLSATLDTSVTAAPAVVTLTQSEYQWFANEDALTPTSPLAVENASVGVPAEGTAIRLRVNIKDTSLALGTGALFSLQFSENSSSTGWTGISSSTEWVFYDNASVADGQVIISPVLSTSNTGESYGESNPSAASPNAIAPGEYGEWDWVIKNNSASLSSNWFFRMVYSSTTLDAYSRFPSLTATSTPEAPPPPSSPPSGNSGNNNAPPVLHPPLPPVKIPPKTPVASVIVDNVDLNSDRRVDIRDFSIFLYYLDNVFLSDSIRADFSRDGKISLADLSILLYYWVE